MTAQEAEQCRLFVRDGKFVNSSGQPFSTINGMKNMVILTKDGKLFSAPKAPNIQHSSFTRGGYLLFAGYFEVKNNNCIKIIAESGHYETPIKSLENFIAFLRRAEVNLSSTEILFAERNTQIRDNKEVVIINHLPLNTKNLQEGNLVTPRRIESIQDSSFKSLLSNSVIPTPPEHNAPKETIICNCS
ncbi:MAG: hypothetical protein A2X78_00460 [Gammaproteobacteria bacterium GWE2_37_16]|nr:MAG: hypothetical protein A2X78_00460 [Gammaproteobacteria bacterium GWE2_37_16]